MNYDLKYYSSRFFYMWGVCVNRVVANVFSFLSLSLSFFLFFSCVVVLVVVVITTGNICLL